MKSRPIRVKLVAEGVVAEAVPKVRPGQVLLMTTEDWIRLSAGTWPRAEPALSSAKAKTVAPVFRTWLRGEARAGLYGKETGRDFYGRVTFTTAQDVAGALRGMKSQIWSGQITSKEAGQLMRSMGFKSKRMKGASGEMISRYFTPEELLGGTFF